MANTTTPKPKAERKPNTEGQTACELVGWFFGFRPSVIRVSDFEEIAFLQGISGMLAACFLPIYRASSPRVFFA